MIKLIVFAALTALSMNYGHYNLSQEDEIEEVSTLIKKGKFEQGTVIIDGTTREVEILKFNRRNSANAFLYCVVKDSSDNITILKPREIAQYRIGKDHYKSHSTDDASFFIKLSRNGKAKLYERKRIPGDNRFLYYLELEGYSDYLVISPHDENFSVDVIPGATNKGNSNSYKLMIHSNKIEEQFKKFVATYLDDCDRVLNSVASGFYTINDVPLVVDVYNNCFEN